MKFLLLLCFTNFITAAELPKTHMLILGGSGEPDTDDTIFDQSLTDFGNYFNTKSRRGELGQSSIAFDGDHTDTDTIRNSLYQNANHNTKFTSDSYQREIDRFKTMMTNNAAIKRGEQVLIYINSHGAEQVEGQKSHGIESGTNGNPDEIVNLDKLAELKSIARNNGIKLGIVDLSCHSGNSQALSDSNTCVISATGPNHYAYNADGFNGTFAKNLSPGENLESAFIKTRSNDQEPDYPMISSPEGDFISKKIYDLISPYLQSTLGGTDHLTNEIAKAASDPVYACQKNNSFNQLKRLLKEIDQNTSIIRHAKYFDTKESLTDFDELQKSLKEYKEIQDLLTEQMKSFNVGKLKNVEQIDSENQYTWNMLLMSDWNQEISNTRKRLPPNAHPSASLQSTLEFNISIFEKAQLKKEKIIRENPELTQYQNVVGDFDANDKKTITLAKKIASNEKKLFDGLYQKYAKENNQSNPCRDFKL